MAYAETNKKKRLSEFSQNLFLNPQRESQKEMSLRNKNGPNKLELRDLSPSPSQGSQMRVVRSPSRSNTTSPSSCVSSETNQEEMETTTSMVLVGCPRCLMYVMLSEDDPKCPKCKSSVLLDFLHQNASTASAANTGRKKSWWN